MREYDHRINNKWLIQIVGCQLKTDMIIVYHIGTRNRSDLLTGSLISEWLL